MPPIVVQMTSFTNLDVSGWDSVKKLDPEAYFRSFISQGIRPDGRYFNSIRKIVNSSDGYRPQTSSSDINIYGSALIKMGGTVVTASVLVLVGTPNSLTPTFGELGRLKFSFHYQHL